MPKELEELKARIAAEETTTSAATLAAPLPPPANRLICNVLCVFLGHSSIPRKINNHLCLNQYLCFFHILVVLLLPSEFSPTFFPSELTLSFAIY